MKLDLKNAEVKDIPIIKSLAEKIWMIHYPPIIGHEQVTYMLEKMYDPASLTEQMEIKKHVFYFVMKENKPVGFISVHLESEGKYMLNKFYILSEEQAKGEGTHAFRLLLKELQGMSEIRLTVNRQNFKSINFYFKNGFKIESVADFDIGNGYYMNDFVMLYQA